MASTRRHATATPSTRPPESLRVSRESSRDRVRPAGGDRIEALLQGSGKLALLDRMLLKLKEAKARVFFSRMAHFGRFGEFLKRYGY